MIPLSNVSQNLCCLCFVHVYGSGDVRRADWLLCWTPHSCSVNSSLTQNGNIQWGRCRVNHCLEPTASGQK